VLKITSITDAITKIVEWHEEEYRPESKTGSSKKSKSIVDYLFRGYNRITKKYKRKAEADL
jgi:hypothetical protein